MLNLLGRLLRLVILGALFLALLPFWFLLFLPIAVVMLAVGRLCRALLRSRANVRLEQGPVRPLVTVNWRPTPSAAGGRPSRSEQWPLDRAQSSGREREYRLRTGGRGTNAIRHGDQCRAIFAGGVCADLRRPDAALAEPG